jgi:hypothetical protein
MITPLIFLSNRKQIISCFDAKSIPRSCANQPSTLANMPLKPPNPEPHNPSSRPCTDDSCQLRTAQYEHFLDTLQPPLSTTSPHLISSHLVTITKALYTRAPSAKRRNIEQYNHSALRRTGHVKTEVQATH